jgi:hypothetical protein
MSVMYPPKKGIYRNKNSLLIKIILIHFGGGITDIWGGYHGHLGGVSRTFGGGITDIWGGYHGHFF